ncbi:hypothetical protein [Methylococcus capsulatus]|uniref:hypothetical protein n=1 Tax=Methylococcus capsulatus TaxID=414 RepID=UPI001C533BE6|nr:hypothetical protein [Methylococcus capsulatus]QXP89116.1 hypothetical protein KW114_08175 [Methylococcus capsulatus]
MLQPQDDLPRHLAAAELGELIGVSARRVRQMLHEDDPPPQDPVTRQFPPRAVGEWLRARYAADFAVSSDGQSYDLEAERARLAHHQANLASMEEQTQRAELIPADVVKERWCTLAANVRAKLLNLPGRGAVKVAGLESVQEIEKELRALVYEALSELAAGK